MGKKRHNLTIGTSWFVTTNKNNKNSSGTSPTLCVSMCLPTTSVIKVEILRLENLTRILKTLAQAYPLTKYFDWDIPENCPLIFPDNLSNQYERNIYLKHHYKDYIPTDDSLESKYWIIQSWGGGYALLNQMSAMIHYFKSWIQS